MGFGHDAKTGTIDGQPFHMDTWGSGPFYIRVGGKRYCFEDSDMFGPAVLRKNLSIDDRQPGEKSQFWDAYQMWRNGGRRTRWNGKVCIWDKPKPGTYWIEPETGLSWFLTDPPHGFDEKLGYIEVPKPSEATP